MKVVTLHMIIVKISHITLFIYYIYDNHMYDRYLFNIILVYNYTIL